MRSRSTTPSITPSAATGNRTTGRRRSSSFRSGAVALAAAALLLPAAPSHAGAAATIDHFGRYDLRALGYGTLSVPAPTSPAPTRASIVYRLPPGAKEGPGHWYLTHLHFRLALAPDTGAGLLYVSSVSNRYASTQVKLDVRRSGGAVRTTVTTTGWVTGSVRRVVNGRTIDFRFANYLPYKAVAPGLNTMSFELERFGDAKVAGLRILPDTAIEYTSSDPAQLALAFSVNRRSVAVGDDVVLTVRMRNTGDAPLRDVVLDLVGAGQTFELVGPARRTHGAIAPHSAAYESFRLHATHAGSVPLLVAAQSSANHPLATVDLRVAGGATPPPAPATAGGTAAWKIALAGVLAAGLLALAVLQLTVRRRR